MTADMEQPQSAEDSEGSCQPTNGATQSNKTKQNNRSSIKARHESSMKARHHGSTDAAKNSIKVMCQRNTKAVSKKGNLTVWKNERQKQMKKASEDTEV